MHVYKFISVQAHKNPLGNFKSKKNRWMVDSVDINDQELLGEFHCPSSDLFFFSSTIFEKSVFKGSKNTWSFLLDGEIILYNQQLVIMAEWRFYFWVLNNLISDILDTWNALKIDGSGF